MNISQVNDNNDLDALIFSYYHLHTYKTMSDILLQVRFGYIRHFIHYISVLYFIFVLCCRNRFIVIALGKADEDCELINVCWLEGYSLSQASGTYRIGTASSTVTVQAVIYWQKLNFIVTPIH